MRNPLHLQGEDGAALLTALFAALVMSALVVVLVANTVSQSRASARSESNEQTLHLAEAGTDLALAKLATDRNYANATGPVPADERQWAIDAAENIVGAGCAGATNVGQGDTVEVVPSRDSWLDPTIIYGVGYHPSCENRDDVRVVRLELDSEPVSSFPVPAAILGGGNLELPMNLKVSGGIHANGELNYGGSSGQIDSATAGSCTPNAISKLSCSVTEPVSVPNRRAREFWQLRTNPSIDVTVPWYDMCPDEIRRPDPGDQTPCNGALVTSLPGWSWDGTEGTWRHSGGALGDGIYYGAGTNIAIVDNPHARVSLLAEGNETGEGEYAGNLKILKNPKFTPVWPGVGMVADVDIEIEQNGAFDGTQTMIYAHEQIKWIQNHRTSGVFFVACDESLRSTWSTSNPDATECPLPGVAGTQDSSNNSPVHGSTIALQNIDIAFDDHGTTLLPGSDRLVVGRWDEVR